MINSSNLNQFDKLLYHLLTAGKESNKRSVDILELSALCDGDTDLAKVIAGEMEARDFVRITRTRAHYLVTLKDNGKASIFYKNGGFRAEYAKLNRIHFMVEDILPDDVQFYDSALNFILKNKILDIKQLYPVCDNNENLCQKIVRCLKSKGFITVNRISSLYTTVLLIGDGTANDFLENGGFSSEYIKTNFPKTNAERLNEHFNKIIEEERIIRIEDYSDDVHRMNDTLIDLGLIKIEGDFLAPSREGLLLNYSGKSVQDYIEKLNTPQPSSSIVNNYNAPVFDRSSLNNSSVNNSHVNSIVGDGNNIIRQVINKPKDNTTTLEKLSWIATIVGVSWATWEFLLKHVLN